MKTDKQKLIGLDEFLHLNRNIVLHRLWAHTYYEVGDERTSWLQLFFWCEAKDIRSKHWKTFQRYYPDAIVLKEGRL